MLKRNSSWRNYFTMNLFVVLNKNNNIFNKLIHYEIITPRTITFEHKIFSQYCFIQAVCYFNSIGQVYRKGGAPTQSQLDRKIDDLKILILCGDFVLCTANLYKKAQMSVRSSLTFYILFHVLTEQLV